MNGIFVPVGAPPDGIKKDMLEITKAILNGGKQIADAAGKISDSTEKATKATKTLTQSFKENYKDAQILAQGGDECEAAFLEAAKAAGKYKKELDDVKIATKILSDDTPLITSLIGVMQGIAGAAGVVTGAMGLIGVESEKVQQMLLKVQSAIALMQGLASLNQLNDSFQALSIVIKANVIPALGTLRGALLATGIVGIVAVLAALAYNFYESNKAAKEAAEGAKKYAEELEHIEEVRVNTIANAQKSLDLQNRNREESLQKELSSLLAEQAKEVEEEAKKFREFKRLGDEYTMYKQAGLKDEADKALKQQEALAFSEKQYNENIASINEYYAKKTFETRKKWSDYWVKYQQEHDQVKMFRRIDPTGLDSVSNEIAKNLRKGISDAIKENPLPTPDPTWFINTTPLREKIKQQFADLKSLMDGIAYQVGASAFQALGASFVTGEFDFSVILNTIAQLASTIASALALIGGALLLVPGLQAQGAAYLAGAAALYVASGAISALGAQSKSTSSGGGNNGSSVQRSTSMAGAALTPMVDGGLVYGPSAVLTGEYSGAKSNPEVIAPLSDLTKILSNVGFGQGGKLEGKLRGRDMYITVREEGRRRNR